MVKAKETSNKIQDRLRIVSFAMQAIPTGVVITREAERIKETQQRIINEINTAPYSLVVALPLQIQFVDDLQMVVRLLTGIVISYGAINQMEKSERKILLDYALQEVENLNRSSYFMLVKIKDIKEKIQWKKCS
jgi:precorrin-4 methylase